MKPDLTENQMSSFDKQFKKLIKDEKILSKLNIQWVLNVPKISSEIIKSLKKKEYDQYVVLLNKINDRTV
jgi:hypothetical protein